MIRLLQYNVKEGFRKIKSPYELEEERLEAAKKVVKRENPDILILNEAYFNMTYEGKVDKSLLIDYQKEFGFDYSACIDCEQGLNPYSGACLLSKYPIIKTEDSTNRKILIFSNEIQVNDKIINLDVLHLGNIPTYTSEELKEAVKEKIPKVKKYHIVSGDFNSFSPEDSYNEDTLYEYHEVFSKKGRIAVEELLKRDVIREMLDKGFIDSYKLINKEFDFTIPTDLLSKNKATGIRIDYTFCSNDFKVISSKIIKDELTEIASDHYPTITELEID